MTRLEKSLHAWGTPVFNDVLKNEIEQLDVQALPLQRGLSRSSYVTGGDFSAMIISAREDDDALHVKAGVFYSGVIAGCGCCDDPTPVPEQSEYCEILLAIDRQTASTRITLADE
ncbi:MAG: hypothetical protein ACE5FQ_11695 [Thiogranum sp.]